MNFSQHASLTGIFLALNLFWVGGVGAATTNSAASLTDGWKEIPFTYQIQHPYDLKTSDRSEVRYRNLKMWVRPADSKPAP